ncbi:MAG: hypothetical protein JWM70_1674 [Microbacteriaceae bacterium]|nr:hypothetical protein [Microbacteriaceae bacterium]
MRLSRRSSTRASDAAAQFRAAVADWAVAGPGAADAAAIARRIAPAVHTVVLVEGESDRVAVEALAAARELDLDGVAVIPMGGATSVQKFVEFLGPRGLGIRLCGLCDAGEEHFFSRAIERAGLGSALSRAAMESLGFFVCVVDLEDELIRALGVTEVERVVDAQGDSRALATFKSQPAQRERSAEQQLRRFAGTLSGRKSRYARAMVDALDPDRAPDPLAKLLAHLDGGRGYRRGRT